MSFLFYGKTVTFFGHRKIENFFETEKQVENIIYKLMQSETYIEFLVGKSGDFDQLVTSVIKRAKRNVGKDNNSLVLVLPYYSKHTPDYWHAYESFYDSIEICEESASAHYKSAYKIRNKNMIDRSDFIVFYVNKNKGGAYEALKYAQKTNKSYINFGNPEI